MGRDVPALSAHPWNRRRSPKPRCASAMPASVTCRMYLGVIVNPLARKNRAAGDRSDELRRIVGPWGEVHETVSVEDLHRIVEKLYPRVSHLVCDGGDGSLNWLINETQHCVSDPERWPTFVPNNGGSVNAVARKARGTRAARSDSARTDGCCRDGSASTRGIAGHSDTRRRDRGRRQVPSALLWAGRRGCRQPVLREVLRQPHSRPCGRRSSDRSLIRRLHHQQGCPRPLEQAQLCIESVRSDTRPRRNRRRGGPDADPQVAARRRDRPPYRRRVPAIPQSGETWRAAFPSRESEALEDRLRFPAALRSGGSAAISYATSMAKR